MSSALTFARQQHIGPYVVDFVCESRKLIIEVINPRMAFHPEQQQRRACLLSHGYTVVEVASELVISQMQTVLQEITAQADAADTLEEEKTSHAI
jgi:very-short-patch-repair endonuclease